jgi:4-hydroxy-4-methyl-2-oxoglutarate aldolase
LTNTLPTNLSNDSTASIADAAFKAGHTVRLFPPSIRPLNADAKLLGPAITVLCNNDLVAVLAGLAKAQKGDVLVIDNGGFTRAGCIGDLIVSEALRKELGGFVIYGSVRDSQQLKALGLPIFCSGYCPVGPLKLPATSQGLGQIGIPIHLEEVTINTGDLIIADADGVIAIEPNSIQGVLNHLESIEQKEQQLVKQLKAGHSLTDLLEVGSYLEKREASPDYSFIEHLASQKQAI